MKRILLIILLICIVLLAIWGVIVWINKERHKGELILYGNVDVRQVDIGFRVAGQVEALYFEEGDTVCPGDLVATLNRTPYTSQVSQAEATLLANKATFDNNEKLYKRRQELIGVEGVSQEDVDNAQANFLTAQANVAAAEAALAVAKDNLCYTKAYAPTKGIILTRIREPGTVVNPSDPVYTISISSPLWIRAFVGEPDLGKICYGMPATVITETGLTYEGQIGFISPVSEFTPKTVETTQLRTDLVYRLRIYVDNPDCVLKQGMPITVKLRVSP
jgi:HlyD family secretion protein